MLHSGPGELGKYEKRVTRKKGRKLYLCADYCKYSSVRKAADFCRFTFVDESEDWHVLWSDVSLPPERFFNLKSYQKLNHFPDMVEICRKDFLARNLNKMRKLFPREYNFFPRTWCFSADYGAFLNFTAKNKNQTFIVKPDGGSQGRGIWIAQSPKDIMATDKTICQKYINDPLLLDGFKFDFRLYVLITHCDPLRIFIYRDGLCRFCTEKYERVNSRNVNERCVHLTNYSINKLSHNFVVDEEAGSKRHVTSVMGELARLGVDVERIWGQIDDMVVKTMMSIQNTLRHNYRAYFNNGKISSSCFEVLGFDILLDRNCKPHLLEVNLSPSLHTDAPIDRKIKIEMIKEIFVLVSFNEFDKRRCQTEQKRRAQTRLTGVKLVEDSETERKSEAYFTKLEHFENSVLHGFRKIYPLPNAGKYEKFLNIPGSLYRETHTFKMRLESALSLRNELNKAKEPKRGTGEGGNARKRVTSSRLSDIPKPTNIFQGPKATPSRLSDIPRPTNQIAKVVFRRIFPQTRIVPTIDLSLRLK